MRKLFFSAGFSGVLGDSFSFGGRELCDAGLSHFLARASFGVSSSDSVSVNPTISSNIDLATVTLVAIAFWFLLWHDPSLPSIKFGVLTRAHLE